MSDGRQGVFIDDGGGSHDLPPSVLVRDFMLYVAVIVKNEDLVSLDQAHSRWLDAARQDAPRLTELHCAELTGSGAWKGVPRARRAHHLRQAYELLLPVADQVLYAYVGRDQYDALIAEAKTAAPELDPRYQSMKTGLAWNFYKVLAQHLICRGTESVVLHDQGLHPEWTQEFLFVDDVPAWEKSIIHVQSNIFAGVQLADLAAWTLNRAFRSNYKMKRGNASELDRIVADWYPKLHAKTVVAWNEPIKE